jgi:Zn-dependent peptidase ImmA (M78 family)
MGEYRRGFKKEANGIVREVRAALGLSASAALDVWALADELGIPLVKLSDFSKRAPDAVRHFTRVETGAFSAMTVFRGDKRLIVYNDRHSRARQASDIAHELAHALLLHPPTVALSDHGCRNWSESHEDEANWLGGALLVPEEAALFVARRKLAIDEAAKAYGVSEDMMTYRLNVTGAARRASAH